MGGRHRPEFLSKTGRVHSVQRSEKKKKEQIKNVQRMETENTKLVGGGVREGFLEEGALVLLMKG